MSREWKPGDMAMVRAKVGDSLTNEHRILRDLDGWLCGLTSFTRKCANLDESTLRPVVVIDPEDREQVKRLYDAYDGEDIGFTDDAEIDAIQAALRSLLGPEKLAEPQGLGAVVEDVDGKRWTRWSAVKPLTPGGIYEWKQEGNGLAKHYADVAAVKVLSEGVTA